MARDRPLHAPANHAMRATSPGPHSTALLGDDAWLDKVSASAASR
jgi:hypothetical protein